MKRIVATAFATIAGVAGILPAHAQDREQSKPEAIPLVARTIHGAPFTIQAQQSLRQNGFVVLGDVTAPDIAAAYPKVGSESPIFVTTDALLQAWFGLSRTRLALAEKANFAPRLARALPELTASAIAFQQQKGASLSGDDRAALRSALVTLAVGEQLMTTSNASSTVLPSDLLVAVTREASRIRAHNLVEAWPGEDYTIYTPRGHYADDPPLTRYFQTSLWLSRRFGNVDFDVSAGGDAGLKRAIALAAILRAAPVSARTEIAALNRARMSLSGPANTVATADLIAALDRTLGAKWTLPAATKPAALQRLRQELQRPIYATSGVAVRQMPPNRQIPRQIVSLLPSAAIPDSALFQATGNPTIPNRKLPTGVEVAAALGASVARREIGQQEPQFARPVLAAVDRFSPKVRADDGATIYSGWLHALATLTAEPPPNAPRYMRSGDAWRYEKLNTVLGGWSELRNTFLLYAEHPAFGSGALHDYPPALVEANPAFFETMASLADRMATVLGPDPALARYAAECRTLAADARLELQTGTLPAKEARELSHFGEWLVKSPTGEAALVADVATGEDGNVLHAATGNLNLMLVQPTGPDGPIYQGWTLSYYEFTRPSGDRMTDTQWRSAVNNPFLAPTRPNWAHHFLTDSVTSGEEGKRLAPIRAAVRLLETRPADGLAALRRIVAVNRDSTLGADAQYAIGRYLYSIGKLSEARDALQKCCDLPGGDSYDAAEALDERIRVEPKYAIGSSNVNLALASSRRERLRFLSRSIAQPTTTADQEMQLTGDFLATLQLLQDVSPEIVLTAAASCHTNTCRDILEYKALRLQSRNLPPDAADGFIRRCVAFANDAMHFRSARIGAFALAVDRGYLKNNPASLLAAAGPFADAIAAKPAPGDAVDPLASVPVSEAWTEGDAARQAFVLAMGPARDLQASRAYYRGRSREAGAILDRFLIDKDYSTVRIDNGFGRFRDLRKSLDTKKEEAALDLIGQAEDALQSGSKVAAACFFSRIASEHPLSALAAGGLYRAAELFEQTGNTREAKWLRQKLQADYPLNFAIARRAIEANYRSFDADTFGDLYQTYDQAQKATSFFALEELYGVFDDGDPSESETFATVDLRLREIKPLLDAARAAGKPLHPTLDQFATDGAQLAHQLVKAMPARREEILRIYMHAFDVAEISREYLTLYPNGDGVGVALEQLLEGRNRVKSEAEALVTIRVIEPYIERGNAFKEATFPLDVLYGLLGHGAAKDDLLGTVATMTCLVRAQFPGTRTAFAADAYLAKLQIEKERPEMALAEIQKLLAGSPGMAMDDPLRAKAVATMTSAQAQIDVKHRHLATEMNLSSGVTEVPLPRSHVNN